MNAEPISVTQVKVGDMIGLSPEANKAKVKKYWVLPDQVKILFEPGNLVGVEFVVLTKPKIVYRERPTQKIRADDVRPGMVMTCGGKDRMVTSVTLSIHSATIELEGCVTGHTLPPGAPVEIV